MNSKATTLEDAWCLPIVLPPNHHKTPKL